MPSTQSDSDIERIAWALAKVKRAEDDEEQARVLKMRAKRELAQVLDLRADGKDFDFEAEHEAQRILIEHVITKVTEERAAQ